MRLTFPRAAGADVPIAVVTGVSRANGIGAAIVHSLASAGAAVLATGWRSFDESVADEADIDAPATLMRTIQAGGGQAHWIEIDLSDPAAAAHVLTAAVQQFGIPSMLVNNAAFSRNDGWQALTAELLDAHYAVNVRATALLTVEFARRWPGGEGGRVINLTSGQFKGPMLGEIAYATSKGAIDAMTVTLAAELAARGITVNAVGPGPTDTGWMSPAIRDELLPRHPLGRLGAPEDIARLVSFLASEQAGWITGQIIHTEGGFLRR